MSPVQGLPLYSADNTVFLIVQSDGNLVLCVLLPSGHLFSAMYSAPMGLREALCEHGGKGKRVSCALGSSAWVIV